MPPADASGQASVRKMRFKKRAVVHRGNNAWAKVARMLGRNGDTGKLLGLNRAWLVRAAWPRATTAKSPPATWGRNPRSRARSRGW